MRRLLVVLTLFWLMNNLVSAQDVTSSPYEIALERIAEADARGELVLNLANMGLSEIPPEIGNLTNLQTLYSWGNDLTGLPSEIGNLSNLRWLYLSNNNLTSVAPEIGSLTNLEVLFLDKNSLTGLPPEISNLTNLEYLYLSDNNLTSLPPEIGYLSNLQWLELEGNPLVSPPDKVIDQGTPAVLLYLRSPILYNLQRLIINATTGVGILTLLGLGLGWQIRRNRKPKKKQVEA